MSNTKTGDVLSPFHKVANPYQQDENTLRIPDFKTGVRRTIIKINNKSLGAPAPALSPPLDTVKISGKNYSFAGIGVTFDQMMPLIATALKSVFENEANLPSAQISYMEDLKNGFKHSELHVVSAVEVEDLLYGGTNSVTRGDNFFNFSFAYEDALPISYCQAYVTYIPQEHGNNFVLQFANTNGTLNIGAGGPYSYVQGDDAANQTTASNIKSALESSLTMLFTDNLVAMFNEVEWTHLTFDVVVNDAKQGFDVTVGTQFTGGIDGFRVYDGFVDFRKADSTTVPMQMTNIKNTYAFGNIV